MNVLGALLGSHSHAGRHVNGSDFLPGLRRGKANENNGQDSDIAQAQQFLSERLSQRLAEKLPAAANSPVVSETNTTAPVTPPASDDFSPAKVTDRILSFIEQRLAQEKANGASDEVLQQRLQQGMEGVRKGMQEAREELESRGMFNGKVRDDYFETFGRVQQGLDGIAERLSGTSATTPTEVPPSGNVVTGPVEVVATGTQWSASSVAVSASREFAMEVTTREGDVVKINVSSARDFAALVANFENEDVSAEGFDATLSGEDNFSFTVEGELDEGEMSALTDLFAQVNDIAETFYGGDVEAAFEQAMAVGYDQNELAGFAANMTQTQTVAVTQAYVGVAQAGGGDVGQGSLLAPLVDFARHVRAAEQTLMSSLESLVNGNDLFRQLLGQLPSGATEATTSVDTGTQETPPWQQFVNGVTAPAAA